MDVASKNKKPGLMTSELPLPLVPIETIPIGDAAGNYEDEHGGAVLFHCANNLHPRRPVTQRPIYPCDSRSKIDTASLELYLPCQESWSRYLLTLRNCHFEYARASKVGNYFTRGVTVHLISQGSGKIVKPQPLGGSPLDNVSDTGL